MQVRSLGREDALEEEMATHSSILAWEIQGTKDPEGYSPWGHKRVGHNWAHRPGGDGWKTNSIQLFDLFVT